MEEGESSPPPPGTISLRPFELSDVDDLAEWVTDERVSRHARWETCKNKEQALDYLKNTILLHPWFRAVCLDGKPVGFIYATLFSDADACRVKLGCSLAWKHKGRGIGTTATKMAVAALFLEMPGLERVEAHTAVENLEAQGMLEKVGFHKDGILRRYCVIKGKLRDMVVYGFLRPYPKL